MFGWTLGPSWSCHAPAHGQWHVSSPNFIWNCHSLSSSPPPPLHIVLYVSDPFLFHWSSILNHCVSFFHLCLKWCITSASQWQLCRIAWELHLEFCKKNDWDLQIVLYYRWKLFMVLSKGCSIQGVSLIDISVLENWEKNNKWASICNKTSVNKSTIELEHRKADNG